MIGALFTGALIETQDKCRLFFGQQRKASAGEAHDLARDAQADAAPSFLGGEKRDEDVPRYLRGDGGAVVADFHDDGLLFVTPGQDVDVPFRRALFLGEYGLYGVFQQVGEDLRHQAFVGVQDEVVRLDAGAEGDVCFRVLVSG